MIKWRRSSLVSWLSCQIALKSFSVLQVISSIFIMCHVCCLELRWLVGRVSGSDPAHLDTSRIGSRGWTQLWPVTQPVVGHIGRTHLWPRTQPVVGRTTYGSWHNQDIFLCDGSIFSNIASFDLHYRTWYNPLQHTRPTQHTNPTHLILWPTRPSTLIETIMYVLINFNFTL